MGAFICQISDVDWFVSREIGVYGNREGSGKHGKVTLFKNSKRGDQTVQSIIEDLIGMKKGDIIFFHVLRKGKESSLNGVYRCSEEPFYNEKKIWESAPSPLVYPYRFCFEPHPDHVELCKHDAYMLVSEFYRAIENRDIRSILTLEREVRGAAHAVKTISSEDSAEIVRLLYKNACTHFHLRLTEEPVDFKPTKMHMEPLRTHIRRIGEIEFAIKALVAYKLGRGSPDLIQYIPACRNGKYDFLIESFIGQTMRRPTDILCINREDSNRSVTILEGKTNQAGIDDLIQSLRYWELFKLRNIDKGSLTYKMSVCLLAQRFHKELVNYVAIRNIILSWEKVILLKYTPTHGGKDATFSFLTLLPHSTILMPRTYPKIQIHKLLLQIRSNPNDLYSVLGKKTPPKTVIGLKSSEKDASVLQRYYLHRGQKTLSSHILIYLIREDCTVKNFLKFMNRTHEEVNKLQGDFQAVEPIIIAKDYDDSINFFIKKYNSYETHARRQPISAYVLS
jgi:hypothetical protein